MSDVTLLIIDNRPSGLMGGVSLVGRPGAMAAVEAGGI